jgi:hypothetical protein
VFENCVREGVLDDSERDDLIRLIEKMRKVLPP